MAAFAENPDLTMFRYKKAIQNLSQGDLVMTYMYLFNFLNTVSEEDKTPEIVAAYEYDI
jgi:hypothetical protein